MSDRALTERQQISVWPDTLSLRDTKLHDDLGGGGQRIYTTAGQGYERYEYVRRDLYEQAQQRIAELEAELDYPHQEIYELMAERDRLRAALESAPKPEYSMSIPSAWTNPEYADWYLGPRTEVLEADDAK